MPPEPASAESPLNMSALNASIEIKGSTSLNLEDTLAFINALSYRDRITQVGICCEERKKEFFSDFDPLQLLKTELVYNGHAAKYLVGNEMAEEFVEQFNDLKRKLQEQEFMVPADDSDIFAFMLFTHENQDLYRDIKTSMIGKKLDNRKQKTDG